MKKTLSIVITIIGIIFWSMGNSNAQVVSNDTCIHPETLNLNSKGKWVTAEIYIPGNFGVDLDSVRIIQIEIQGNRSESRYSSRSRFSLAHLSGRWHDGIKSKVSPL